MTDTLPTVEAIYREMLMRRSPEERLLMGCSMFQAARSLLISSFPPGLTPVEMNKLLFLNTYAHDYPAEISERIVGRIESLGHGG